jgi:hypothetical protein
MDHVQDTTQPVSGPAEPQTSAELVKLIRKLRWIGLEEEAHQLQLVLNRFPPEERSVVSGAPIECD